MRHLINIRKIVGITLVSVLALILIYDIQPVISDTQTEDQSVPVSEEPPTSDHSDECDDSCPCVIHVLEESLDFTQHQIENNIACSSVWTAICLKPESEIQEGIDRPPEA